VPGPITRELVEWYEGILAGQFNLCHHSHFSWEDTQQMSMREFKFMHEKLGELKKAEKSAMDKATAKARRKR